MNLSITRPQVLASRLLAILLIAFPLAIQAQLSGNVVIDQTSESIGEDSTITLTSLTVINGGSLTIGGGSQLTVNENITVDGTSKIIVETKNSNAQVDGQWAGEGVSISAVNVDIAEGGALHADGTGYTFQKGPGGAQAWNQGGTHAGSSQNNGSAAYGSVFEPATPGSGGGRWSGIGSSGGGAIKLNVANQLRVDGKLSANGVTFGASNSASAGGSLWIITSILSGKGAITTNAGTPNPANYSAGSGGRIALYYENGAQFTNWTGITASASSENAGDGTVYIKDTANNHLHVWKWTPMGGDNFEDITVYTDGLLEIDGASLLEVSENLTIQDGGILRVKCVNTVGLVDDSWKGEGSTITAKNMTIQSGGQLEADGQGYQFQQGPGGAQAWNEGGTHGGSGQNNASAPYGSVFEPTTPGSGGGRWSGTGSRGGGAIKLNVTNQLRVDGKLSADGLTLGASNSASAGGSLWITTNILRGNGTITTNAGAPDPVNYSAGSGGRIAIYYKDGGQFTNWTGVTASASSTNAGDGTVYIVNTQTDHLHVFRSTPLGSQNYNDITIYPTGLLDLAGDSALNVTNHLLIQDGGKLRVHCVNVDALLDDQWQGRGSTITATDITINENGSIDADGQGYFFQQGPGGANAWNQGGTHGGAGEDNASLPYGSQFEPETPGSGGGRWNGIGSRGGGAVRLNVSNQLSIDGRLSADGVTFGASSSAGAGGSLWITTNILRGNGAISANASAPNPANYASGAGGRIAIYYQNAAAFTAWDKVTASASNATLAENGTVFLKNTSSPAGDLFVRQRLVIDPNSVISFSNLTVLDGGILEAGGGSTINVAGKLDIRSGGTFLARATINQPLEPMGEGVEIIANQLVIAEGGHLTADGQGFGPESGPGRGMTWAHGAGHGGLGGGTMPGAVYGVAAEPTAVGSGGGLWSGAGSVGGGALRMIIHDLFELNGTVSANGIVRGGNSSGSSGGSIWVTTSKLEGGGTFHANGGAQTPGGYHGGGGGRIAVYFEEGDQFSGFSESSVNGGLEGGGEGTCLFMQTIDGTSHAHIHHRYRFDSESAEEIDSLSIHQEALFELAGGATLDLSGDLLLKEDAVLVAESVGRDGRNGRGVTIGARNVTVETGAHISADGWGYAQNLGPGGGSAYNTGASHGGMGSGPSPAPVYGDRNQPLELGSGGGIWSGPGTSGGGAILMNVGETLHLEGRVSANAIHRGPSASGASGGSVWISASRITGTGSIEANGGEPQPANYGHGGGGRISLYVWIDQPLPNGTIEALGSGNAEDGSVETSSTVFLSAPKFSRGETLVQWFGPSDADIELYASSAGLETPITRLEGQLFSWDTTAVPDGVYELRAIIRNPVTGEISGEPTTTTTVLNDVVWHTTETAGMETWSANQIHLVSDGFSVGPGSVVTVEPGAVIKMFPKSALEVKATGTLQATGSAANPIVITSIYDDTVGGDTNHDGSASGPSAGDWRGVVIDPLGILSLNQFVDLRYLRQTVAGEITEDSTWLGNSLVVIDDQVTVASGVTLTILPGCIIKMGDKAEFIFNSGATLSANGTATQPIVFTSILDDGYAGDTNQDGNATSPDAGDWRWIYLNATTANLSHVHILNGGGTTSGSWSGTGVIRTTGASELNMRSCRIQRSFFDGILAWGGPVLLENCIFTDCDRAISAHPGSPVTVRNSVFDRNRRSLFVHGGSLNAYNTIVTNGTQSSVGWDFGAQAIVTERCIFWSPNAASGEFEGIASQIGQQGNLNVDPLFVDSLRNDFRLSYGSPALDSGDGTHAPEFDYLGTPRVDEPSAANTGTPAANGNHPDRGAFEFSENAESPLDLVVSSVSGPTEATVGEMVTLNWIVVNRGSAPVVGPWTDRISLVRNPGTENEEIRFAADIPGGGNLGPGESLELSAEVVVPGALNGPHRWQVETNSRSAIFEGLNRSNNKTLSTASVDIALPELILGAESFAGRFDQVGGGYWFVLNAASQDVVIDAQVSGDDDAVTGIYLGYGTLPSRNQHDGKQVEFGSDDVSAFVRRQGSPVYVFVTADALNNPGVGVTISAKPVEFSIKSVSPRSIGNTGSATLEISGASLGENLEFELVSSTGQVHPATKVYSTDSLKVFPTFPLDGLPKGTYKVRARDGAALVEAGDTVVVTDTVPAQLDVDMLSDDRVRAGRESQTNFVYRNSGNVDLIAPIMKIIATVTVKKTQSRGFGVKHGAAVLAAIPLNRVKYVQHFVAISETGPAGIIRPTGFGGNYTSSFDVPVDEPNMEIQLKWIADTQNGDAFPWTGLKTPMKPPGATQQGWDKVFDNLMSLAGSTYGEVNSFVADTATQLGRVGERENNLLRLIGLSTYLADPSGSLYSLGEQRKVGRYLPDPTKNQIDQTTGGWDQRAVRIVHFLGTRRFYEETLDPDRFVPSVDDGSELIKTGTGYTINEYDGGSIKFNEDGKQLVSFSDGLAITILAGYENDQLVRLEQNGVTVLGFEYDANGYLAKQRFFDGTETTYTHNANGELTEWQHSVGPLMNFDYYSAGPASGLLKSMEDHSGVVEFAYDSFGRLEKVTSDGSETTYRYPAFGKTEVEIDGQVFEETRDANYNLAVVKGPDGDTVSISDGEFKSVYSSSTGSSLVHEYNKAGFLTRMVNGNGRSRSVTIDPIHETFARVTDDHGGTTVMTYDSRGELEDMVFPDGTTSYQTYDARGNGATYTNRQGRKMVFEYFPGTDRLKARVYPDGARDEFTYDPVGRILTATNGTGITSFEYDALGAITKVTYPHGHSLSYEYDDLGRRVSMTDDSGFVTRYRFDQKGQLDAVLNDANEEWVEYDFDSVGRVAQRNNANGTVSAYRYEAVTGALESVTHRDSADQIINQAAYSANPAGTRLSKVTIDGETSYVYDNLNQLISQSGADGDYSFSYDSAGNRTQAIREGQTSNYLSDTLDRYLKAGAATLSYNPNGDLRASKSHSEEWLYDYDVEGKLTGYRGGGLNVVYQYDALGNRVSEIVNGVEKHYLLDPVGDLETVTAITSSGRSQFVFSHHGLIAQVTAEGAYYYHEDGSFNVTEITDESQEVVNSYRYSPFGNVRDRTEGISNSFTFGGSLGNIETANQQYWIFMRQYDPDLGRFHVLDSARMPGSNGYLYGSNDPINRIDINGNEGVLSTYISDSNRNNGMTGVTTASGAFDTITTNLQQSVNNMDHSFEVERSRRQTARSRQAYDQANNEYNRRVRKRGPKLTKKKTKGLGKRRNAAKKNWENSRRNLEKTKKQGPPKAKSSGVAKKLSYLGTANALYNLDQTFQDYRNGKTPGYEVLHKTGVLGGDLLQYVPGLGKVGNIIATVADPLSQAGFDWYFTPSPLADEDVFGPRGLELRNGRHTHPRIVGSYDPNDKASTGLGENGYIAGDVPITYTIRFENLKTATAAAQQVVVTDPLDSKLDWSTFRLTEFGFNGEVISITSGQQGYRGVHQVDTDPNPIQVDISLDPITGVLRYEAKSFDPLTQDFPADPEAGFLPPNDETGRGEGYLKFSVWPDAGLPHDTRIENDARIVFDVNPPIDTNVAVNTIDLEAPTSAVAAFPANSPPNFVVNLSGDDGTGSGIDYYEVFVSVNGGPFTLYDTMDETSFVYAGVEGINYAFYSVATDNLGFEEPDKTSADASVTPVAPVGDPYADWAAARFGAATGNPALEATLWGKQADPDGDGFANIIESYMNLDPQIHDTANALQPEASGDQFTVTYSRSKSNRAATELRPQVSTDVETWTSEGINQEIIEDLGDAVRVRATIARDGNRTMFFRLRVQ